MDPDACDRARPPAHYSKKRAGTSDAAAAVHEERYDGTDQKDHEQDLGDPGGACRGSAKSEHGGDERYDKKNDGIMKHGIPL